jgi:hypothetical protein
VERGVTNDGGVNAGLEGVTGELPIGCSASREDEAIAPADWNEGGCGSAECVSSCHRSFVISLALARAAEEGTRRFLEAVWKPLTALAV